MDKQDSQFISDLYEKMIAIIMNGFEDGSKWAAHMLWDIFISFLKIHWFKVIVFIFVAVIFTTGRAMFGRWGALGSLLYNLFYLGSLFIIGLIWGPEVFLNDIFNTFSAVVLYPICYKLVGLVLILIGIR